MSDDGRGGREPENGAAVASRSYAVVATQRGDVRPSLEPATLRAERACRRLNELAVVITQVKELVAETPMEVRVRRQHLDAGVWADPQIAWQYDQRNMLVEHEIRALTGEVISHLRTSLEYLAYHLVWHDRGRPWRGSQFPVVDEQNRHRWEEIVHARLRGLSQQHLSTIQSLQPFAGCTWTATLSRLSNADKHRSPIRVAVGTGALFDLEHLVVYPDKDPDWYVVDTTPAVDVKTHDGQDLYATLLHLLGSVVETLQTFSADLPGADDLRLKLQ